MEATIRPSADLRNHYNEISKQCKESREAVIITVNGRGESSCIFTGKEEWMKYKMLRTDKAEDQLRETIFYTADDSGDVNIALGYLDKIETAINRLQEFPESGSIPRYSILKKQGYSVLIVERHFVFYKINKVDPSVIIYAIVDGKREYSNLL